MRTTTVFLTLSIAVLIIVSCGKDKAASPARAGDQGYAVTLQYQNYFFYQGRGWGCLRLSLDDNPVEQCGLGSRSINLWTRQYEWRLYTIDIEQQPETYRLIRQGIVVLDRNKTCVVDGSNVTWQ